MNYSDTKSFDCRRARRTAAGRDTGGRRRRLFAADACGRRGDAFPRDDVADKHRDAGDRRISAAASSSIPATGCSRSFPAPWKRCARRWRSRTASMSSRSERRRTSGSCFASASTSATSSSARTTSSETASISRPGSRASRSPAAFACRRRRTIRSTARSASGSPISASRTSRTSAVRSAPMR